MSRINLIIILLFFSILSKAQDEKIVNDLQLKTALQFDYNFSKKLDVKVGYLNVLKQDISILDEQAFDIELGYKIFKNIEFASTYRYTWNKARKNEVWRNYNRITFDSKVSHKTKPFNLIYRLRLENVTANSKISFAKDSVYASHIRNKLQIEYQKKKYIISPFFNIEHFYNYNSLVNKNNKIRYGFGANYKIKKWGAIKLCYQITQEQTHTLRYTFYTIYSKFTYKF